MKAAMVDVLFYLGVVLSLFSQFPQIKRLLKRKKSFDISLPGQFVIMAALGTGAALAWLTGSSRLVVLQYLAGCAAVAVVVVLVVRYRRQPGGKRGLR